MGRTCVEERQVFGKGRGHLERDVDVGEKTWSFGERKVIIPYHQPHPEAHLT